MQKYPVKASSISREKLISHMQTDTNKSMQTPSITDGVHKLSKIEMILFIVLIFVFALYSVFIAINLEVQIIPDEPAHFLFSKYYATTLGIPPDIPETYSLGWYISHNPFLYFWINARVINLVRMINPSVNDTSLLHILRLLSSLYTIGTLVFLLKLSCLIIPKKGWRILPVFLLSNTLMFVFLSGGVNYDNMAIFFSMASVYYLTLVFTGRDYQKNTLRSVIYICLGCLVKFTILPLALPMFLAWFLFTVHKRKDIFPLQFRETQTILMTVVLFILLLGNLLIYGHNIIVFGSITARCSDILTETQCALDPYYLRAKQFGPEGPMGLIQAVEKGYPHPVTYLFDFWIKDMFSKIYGILGHKVYFPAHIIPFYQLFYLMIMCLSFLSWKDVSFSRGSLIFIVLFYLTVVFITNYKSELAHTFQHVAGIQGRYLFPIIGPLYVLVGYTLSRLPNKVLRFTVLAITLILFFAGGPFKFVKLYANVFSDWFIR